MSPFMSRARRGLLGVMGGLAVLMATAVHAGSVTYVYTDPQGTPLAEADASGNITATYDYAPYGSQALGTPPNGPGYTGHVNDPDTGLVYMQARYYDPGTGRFLSTDPLMPSVGALFSFNRYDYAGNNPINDIDPDGRECTGSLNTNASGNCSDSGKSVASSGPGSGAVVQAEQQPKGVKQVLIGLAKSVLSVVPADAGQKDPTPSNESQSWGMSLGAAIIAGIEAELTEGLGNEGAGDEIFGTLRGSDNPVTAEAAAYGRHMHKFFDYGPGFEREFRFQTGRQADAINFRTREILELKPNNRRAISRGELQLEQYKEDAHNQFGGEWTGRVITYDRP